MLNLVRIIAPLCGRVQLKARGDHGPRHAQTIAARQGRIKTTNRTAFISLNVWSMLSRSTGVLAPEFAAVRFQAIRCCRNAARAFASAAGKCPRVSWCRSSDRGTWRQRVRFHRPARPGRLHRKRERPARRRKLAMSCSCLLSIYRRAPAAIVSPRFASFLFWQLPCIGGISARLKAL